MQISFSPPWTALTAILLLLGIVVPWRGAVRMRALMARSALTSTERIAIYGSTIAYQWILCGLHGCGAAWRLYGWSLAESGAFGICSRIVRSPSASAWRLLRH